MLKPTLVVLAAGIGSRYGGLKQIDPIGPNGELIIDYSIYDALESGFGQVVFVISEAIEEPFRERVGRTCESQCETTYVFQSLDDVPKDFKVPPNRQKPWGTAHATWSCRNVVHTPFAVINADDFYGRSAYQALCDHLRSVWDSAAVNAYCMVSYLLENTLSEHGHVSRGVCTVNQDGYLVEIHERTHIERFGQVAKYTEDKETWVEIPRGTPVSMNIWGFTPSLFSELEILFPHLLQEHSHDILKAEFLLPVAVGDLIRNERAMVKTLPAHETWFGVTYQEDKPKARQAMRDLIHRGVYPDNLWAKAP